MATNLRRRNLSGKIYRDDSLLGETSWRCEPNGEEKESEQLQLDVISPVSH